MRKKLFSGMMSLTAAAMMMTACSEDTEVQSTGAEANSNEPVTITFWDENAGPQRSPIWEELIKRFEAEHENIDVEYVGLPKDSAKQKLDAAIAADDMPDVASIQTSWLPEFAVRDALLPLDEQFDSWEAKEKINASAVGFNKEIVMDGKLYGIPYTQNIDILWYRPDWFQEKNIKAPETWEDFFTAVETMTDKSSNRYGYTIRGGAGGSFQLQRMMYAYSGIEEYIGEDGKSTINDPKHVEFLEKYFDLYETYTPKSDITNGYKEMIAGFDTGAVAMVQHNVGSYGEHSESLEPGQFKALALPKSDDGKYVAEGGNTIGISIFKTTEHPEAAWEFTEFLNSAESQSYWNEQVGQIPTNSDVLQEEWVKNADHIKVAFEVYEDPALVLYEPPFYLPDYRSILDNTVDSGIQNVMSGKMTVPEFLDEWAGALEESQKQYDEHFSK